MRTFWILRNSMEAALDKAIAEDARFDSAKNDEKETV